MTPALEKGARAICRLANPLATERYIEARWRAYLPHAGAVLESLLPPSPEVVEAIHKRWREGPDFRVRDACASAFTAAIKSILGEDHG